ncbi:hypothetical protein B0H17DRAFT_1206164 [Mycena rosella]|uniref:Hydrophobin n=1 Tax=Mycena rosella TaxID=1033263 RepID=A0AAD7D5I1_MYCRO|nr:hypothetical protein B0H17DRAFT_1206164 [Mycena rosella]
MKSSTTVFVCALSFAISALASDSNADRLARGLPPLPPRRRQPGAKRLSPSSTPFHCDTKKTFCCADLPAASSAAGKSTLSGLGIPSTSCGEHIGTGCVAAIGDSCIIGTPATCCGNLFGLVGIDCMPVTPSTSSSRAASSASASSSHPATSSHANSPALVVRDCVCLARYQLDVHVCFALEQLRVAGLGVSECVCIACYQLYVHVRVCFAVEQLRVLHLGPPFLFGQHVVRECLRLAWYQLDVRVCFALEQLPFVGIGPPLLFGQRECLCLARYQLYVRVRVWVAFCVLVGPTFVLGEHAYFVGLAVECIYLACYQLPIRVCVWVAFRVIGAGPPLVFGLEQCRRSLIGCLVRLAHQQLRSIFAQLCFLLGLGVPFERGVVLARQQLRYFVPHRIFQRLGVPVVLARKQLHDCGFYQLGLPFPFFHGVFRECPQLGDCLVVLAWQQLRIVARRVFQWLGFPVVLTRKQLDGCDFHQCRQQLGLGLPIFGVAHRVFRVGDRFVVLARVFLARQQLRVSICLPCEQGVRFVGVGLRVALVGFARQQRRFECIVG